MNSKEQIEAKEARREYMRRWRSEHPESVKAAQMRYWTKKAAEMKAVGNECRSADQQEGSYN